MNYHMIQYKPDDYMGEPDNIMLLPCNQYERMQILSSRPQSFDYLGIIAEHDIPLIKTVRNKRPLLAEIYMDWVMLLPGRQQIYV
jgi:hypothetical protein